MISKLCRSSCSSLNFLNKPQWCKGSYNIVFNRSDINMPRRFTHSYDKIDQLESFPDVENFVIPDLPNEIVNTISEPSFASLGLCNYTPSGLVQSILENVHISLDLPWWACIMITAVLLRTCMLPILVQQRRALVNYQNGMSTMTSTLMEAAEAKEKGDSLLMLAKMKKIENIVETENMSLMPLMKPIFIQGPVFLSVFMALRGMAEVPVASLKTGGLSWFTDLTVYDPYYILPLITALSLAIVLETGAEAPTAQGKNMKMAFRCLPPIVFCLVCHFPSTLLLYWTCSNIFSLAFVSLMKIPEFQKAINFPTIVPAKPIPNANNIGMKETLEIIRSVHEVNMRERAEQMRWKAREGQEEILQTGLAAAKARLKLKQEMNSNKSSDGGESGGKESDMEKK